MASAPRFRSLVDEHVGNRIPECATESDALRGAFLHPLKRTVFHDGVPPRLIDGDVEKGRDATDLSSRALFEIAKVNERQVGQVTGSPSTQHFFPEQPKRAAVSIAQQLGDDLLHPRCARLGRYSGVTSTPLPSPSSPSNSPSGTSSMQASSLGARINMRVPTMAGWA